MAATYKPVGQLFSESSTIVKRNLRLFVWLNIINIFNVAWQIGLVLRDKTNGGSWGHTIWNSFTDGSDYHINGYINLLLVVAQVVLVMLSTILAVKAVRKNVVDFGDVWDTFKAIWWKLILVAVVVGIPIGVGLILFLLPGLYLLSRLILAPYILIDQQGGVMESANRSWELTKGRAWPVFVAFLFGAILELPSIVPVVGQIVALILTILYSAGTPLRYFELKGSK